MHVRVELPEPPLIEGEDRVHERLVALVLMLRATVPANPLDGVTVIVEFPETPGLVETLVAVAVMKKSWT